MREDKGYRFLHGHLHLLNALTASGEVLIETQDEGKVKVIKTQRGIAVEHGTGTIPVLIY